MLHATRRRQLAAGPAGRRAKSPDAPEQRRDDARKITKTPFNTLKITKTPLNTLYGTKTPLNTLYSTKTPFNTLKIAKTV